MSIVIAGDMHMRMAELLLLSVIAIAMVALPYRLHARSHVICKKIVPRPVIIAKKIIRPPDPELTRILDAIKEILNK